MNQRWKNIGVQQFITPRRSVLSDIFDHFAVNFDHLADKNVRETFLRGLMICCTPRFFHSWSEHWTLLEIFVQVWWEPRPPWPAAPTAGSPSNRSWTTSKHLSYPAQLYQRNQNWDRYIACRSKIELIRENMTLIHFYNSIIRHELKLSCTLDQQIKYATFKYTGWPVINDHVVTCPVYATV